eukprot:scaffold2548_cov163-Ochromonas_danica.AAC.2
MNHQDHLGLNNQTLNFTSPQSCITLQVNALPKYCDENELSQLFAGFPDIVQTRMLSRNALESTGIVIFASVNSALVAKSQIDGLFFHGRKLRIDVMNEQDISQELAAHQKINSVYIRYSSKTYRRIIGEEDLQPIFALYGPVLEVCIKDANQNTVKGLQAAFKAVASLDGAVVRDIHFRVELSRNLLRQFNDGMRQAAQQQPWGPPSMPPQAAREQQQFPMSRGFPGRGMPDQYSNFPTGSDRFSHPSPRTSYMMQPSTAMSSVSSVTGQSISSSSSVGMSALSSVGSSLSSSLSVDLDSAPFHAMPSIGINSSNQPYPHRHLKGATSIYNSKPHFPTSNPFKDAPGYPLSSFNRSNNSSGFMYDSAQLPLPSAPHHRHHQQSSMFPPAPQGSAKLTGFTGDGASDDLTWGDDAYLYGGKPFFGGNCVSNPNVYDRFGSMYDQSQASNHHDVR